MPKKKSKESKEKFDIERFDELDKLKFDKDVFSKEDKASQDEEDEEDEEVEKSESEENLELNLGDLEFSQFMPSSEPSGDRVPVLERIAGSQPGPVFVGGIPQTPVNISGEEKIDEFKYVPGQGGNDEPKYISSDSRISAELTPVDLMKVGRQTELIPQNQETFFMRSESRSQIESPTFERGWKAERIDIEKAGRRDSFEEHDAKYENYKPKLPK